MVLKRYFLGGLLLVFASFFSCKNQVKEQIFRLEGTVFGTTYHITYQGSQQYQKSIDQASSKLDEINQKTMDYQAFVKERGELALKYKEYIDSQKDNIDQAFQKLKIKQPGWNDEQNELVQEILSDIAIYGKQFASWDQDKAILIQTAFLGSKNSFFHSIAHLSTDIDLVVLAVLSRDCLPQCKLFPFSWV